MFKPFSIFIVPPLKFENVLNINSLLDIEVQDKIRGRVLNFGKLEKVVHF